MRPKIQLKPLIGDTGIAGLFTKSNATLLLIFVLFFFASMQQMYGQNSRVPVTFTLSTSSNTSAGIFRPDSTLVRTLWNNVRYPAGSHTQYWDRKDDDGKLVNDSNFVVRVVSNNVTYKWDGAIIGNTSDSITGLKKHRYFTRPNSMAIFGNQAYYTVGYIEGFTSCYKFSLSAPQNKIGILYNTNHDIDMEGSFTATDGVRVYWAGYDPYNTDITFTYATTVAADKEVMFSSGASVAVTYGRTYPSAIDLYTNNAASRPSGLAVQKNGNYLFISHQGLDELHVLDKTTGALVQTISINDPRQLCVDMNDNLWMIYDANTVEKFTVNTNGTISSASLTISGLSEPLALAVSPNNYMIVVADGGSSQQIKAFNNNNGNTVWTLGLAGGYATDPSVTNTKFCFSHQNTNLKGSFIAFQSDSSFWIGDPGNERVQHFGASRNYINNIMSLPKSYCVQADRNDPTRVFNEYLEFKIDYSKTLAVGNGSWTLVKNWRCGVPANYYLEEKNNILRDVITLSNGRTYAAMEDLSNPGFRTPEIVELPSSGHMRFTGIQLEAFENFIIDLDGTLRTLTGDGSIGKTAEWTSRRLTGFDNNNNPIWANPVSIAKTPKVVLEDPLCDGPSFPAKTSSDVLVVFNPWQIDNAGKGAGYHLGAVKKGSTNKWLWMTSKATAKTYSGPMPSDGAFDCGNNVEYPGGHVYAVDRNIFWNYHGEFWKNSQTNIWNHYYDNGLMIGQFGVETPDGLAYDVEAFAGGAGNVFSSTVVKVGNDYYIYHNDESEHGGVHRWKIAGLNTIQEQSSTIKISTVNGGLLAAYFDGTDLNNFNYKASGITSTVNLSSAPTQVPNSNSYSVKWTGFVNPAYSQAYTFYTNTSNGVRLWIDGNLVINRWTNATATEYNSGAINLIAGKKYSIKMEINGGTASLSWASTSVSKQIIPSSALFPANAPDYSKTYDLLEGFTPGTTVQNNLYGWTRNSVNEDNTSSEQYWNVRTGIKSHHKDRTDLAMRFRQDATDHYVTRDLGTTPACLTSWKIQGTMNMEESYPAYDDEIGGVHIDVLDDQGKVICKITHEMTASNNNAYIKFNGKSLITKSWYKLNTLTNKHQPFSIDVTSSGVTFTYATFAPVTVKRLDTTSSWNKPKTLRVYFTSRSWNNYMHAMNFGELSYSPVSNQTIATASGPTTFCQGGSVVLTASAGSSYLWSNNATTKSITANSSGSYSVKVKDAAGCEATSNIIPVTVNPLPSAVITASGPTTFCQGGSVTLTAPVSKTYLWNNSATSRSINVTSQGTYSVAVTDNNGCGASSLPVAVTVTAGPTATVSAGGPITFCQGKSVVLTCNQTGTYRWTNNATSKSITVNSQGIYAVELTDGNGCKGISNATVVTVNSLPNANITASGPTSFCVGGSVTLSASPAQSYLWSNSATTQSIVVQTPGAYSVEITDQNLCVANSVATNVNVNIAPKPVVTVNDDILTSSEVNNNQWYKDGSPIANATGQIFKATDNGSYMVEVDNQGCKGSSDPVVLSHLSIDNPKNSEFFKVYPNPNSGKFTLELKTESIADVRIMNSLGQVIDERKVEGSMQFDLSSFSAGIYIIYVKIGDSYLSERITIQ